MGAGKHAPDMPFPPLCGMTPCYLRLFPPQSIARIRVIVNTRIIKHNGVILSVRQGITMIVFDRLWQTMKRRGITQYRLIKEYHISTGQLDRLRKNENVSTYTLNALCRILDCSLEEIAEYREE